jgi:OOP family OmpA-OmpF porin
VGQTINFIKGFRMKKLIFALIAAATAVGSAQAQQAYVGVGVASADHSSKLPGTTNGSSDGFKASGKLFGGYDFDKTWGVEAGYTDFRSSNYSYTLGGQNYSGKADGHSFYVAGKATAPINEQFSVYGKLGAAENKRTLSDPVFGGSKNKTEVYAGIGGQYNLNQKVALTLEYERYGKSTNAGAKPDVITVGAKYAF